MLAEGPIKVAVQLKVPVPKPVQVDARETALVIVDMENGDLKPGGSLQQDAHRVAVLQPIRQLLDGCRQAGVRVIFVQSVRDAEQPEFTVFGRKPYFLRGTWDAEIVAELTPLPDEPVVEKNTHDCFCHTRMEAVLAQLGIVPYRWNVVVVGLGLTNCVGCAISGFSVRGYRVVVPMDCTASATWEEEVTQYQRFMGRAYNYNVAITRSDLLTIAAVGSRS